jgi:hypothetical protein
VKAILFRLTGGKVYHSLPCPSLLKNLCLHQGEHLGYFYSEKDELVVFEEKGKNSFNNVFIRLDELKNYLCKMNYRICWVCFAEKHYYYGMRGMGQEWTDWSGFFELEGNNAVGSINVNFQ